MAVFDWAVSLAEEMVAKYGQDAKLRSFARAEGADADAPHRTGTVTASDKTVKMLFLSYKQKYVDGTVVKTGDQRVLMPSTDKLGKAITPTVDCVIVRGSEIWKIIAVSPLQPNEQKIMYGAQVRQ